MGKGAMETACMCQDLEFRGPLCAAGEYFCPSPPQHTHIHTIPLRVWWFQPFSVGRWLLILKLKKKKKETRH